MKKIIIFPKILFFFYLIIGIFLSINTGISHDELSEELNWLKNFEAYKSIFGFGDYKELASYREKYYGISFQLISQPIQFFTYSFVSEITETSKYAAYLLSKHISIFLIFFLSGIYFYRLCFLISNSKKFSIISTFIYLTFPYLYGHALINPKDIPFLAFWLISTFYYFKILKLVYDESYISFKSIFKLAIFTSFLVSVRIAGLIIFFEFVIGLFVLLNFKKKIDFFFILRKNLRHIYSFILIFLFTIYILNPVVWFNPLEIINSISHMSKYFNNVCTLTLGKCQKSLDLPASYYFIWIFFKLPIISLFGLSIYPLIEKKIFKSEFSNVILLTIIISIVSIILLFILKKVAIYDEIRHILFIVPLILIVSFYSIYLLKEKIFYFFSFITLILFFLDSFKMYPYQYTWMNEFARLYDINKNFEIDYWGTSNINLQKKIINFYKREKYNNNICVYGDAYTSAYLEKYNFKCFDHYVKIDEIKVRPFLAYQNLRNLKRNSPNNCELMSEENYSYFFSKQKLVVGKLWYCY